MEILGELPFRPQLIDNLLVLALFLFPQSLTELDPMPFRIVYRLDLLTLVQQHMFYRQVSLLLPL